MAYGQKSNNLNVCDGIQIASIAYDNLITVFIFV